MLVAYAGVGKPTISHGRVIPAPVSAASQARGLDWQLGATFVTFVAWEAVKSAENWPTTDRVNWRKLEARASLAH
eukprot:1266825-Prymnesium_polylepis.1